MWEAESHSDFSGEKSDLKPKAHFLQAVKGGVPLSRQCVIEKQQLFLLHRSFLLKSRRRKT